MRVLCPQCKSLTGEMYLRKSQVVYIEGKKGRVFWDKDGNRHDHYASVRECVFECSNGHKWSKFHRPFPVCASCGWPEQTDIDKVKMERDWGIIGIYILVSILGFLAIVALALIATQSMR